jgi:hypothetical protein
MFCIGLGIWLCIVGSQLGTEARSDQDNASECAKEGPSNRECGLVVGRNAFCKRDKVVDVNDVALFNWGCFGLVFLVLFFSPCPLVVR